MLTYAHVRRRTVCAGRSEDVKVLLQAGANACVSNAAGITALQAAEKNGHLALAALLQRPDATRA
jgi:ankyrin repeat protein